MKAKSLFKSVLVLSCGAMVMASCSKTDDFGAASLEQLQEDVYSSAFIKEFGKPAADHDWGFGAFEVVGVTEPIGSYEYFNSGVTRSEVGSVTPVSSKVYDNFVDAYNDSYDGKEHVAKCYFYVRLDNAVVLQEQNQVLSNPKEKYYPQEIKLGDVQDCLFNTDNEGLIDAAMLQRIANVPTGGVSYATSDEPMPDELFIKAPSFATMAAHIPDSEKARIAGSVAEFENNWKVFWYVAKWQEKGDKKIHVDGVVVPKDQITVNVPEYKKRIIVEDLKGNIDEKTSVSGSDFDFNDVVFDAVTWKDTNNKNHLKIILRAAGGILPIYVNGVNIHDHVDLMFNTVKPDYTYGKEIFNEIINEEAKTFDFNSIPVEVEINGRKVTAESNIGEAPEKVAVDLDYQWVEERTKITDVYSKFADYVKDKSVTNWWK